MATVNSFVITLMEALLATVMKDLKAMGVYVMVRIHSTFVYDGIESVITLKILMSVQRCLTCVTLMLLAPTLRETTTAHVTLGTMEMVSTVKVNLPINYCI